MSDTFRKFDLSGKTAFITGGGTGLGYVMSRALLRLGARVMIAARRADVLEQSAIKLRAETGGEVLVTTVDLSDLGSVAAASAHATEALGGVDIFIGNGGQDGLELLDVSTDAVVEQLFKINTISNISLSRAFLPHMRARKWGRVMFSSSITSKCGTAHEGMSAYAATKGALNSFVRVAAAETGHDGITFNSLIFGVYLTEIMEGVLATVVQHQGQAAADAFVNTFASMTALGRLGNPEEIEGVIQLLASPAGSYITGAEIPVDGGLSITMKPNMPG